ncbi:MAG TPA: alpha/beta hydrolase [Sandaracinaceae bacterium LLY-WYZ-13_1]|nr:alpha/beta hydrolase [Sandaracinaceae bacterium LLY-WYZ-13_1]
MHARVAAGLVLCFVVACDGPWEEADAGADAGRRTDAGERADAGPPEDPSRPGRVSIVDDCEVPPSPDDGAVRLEEDLTYATVNGEALRLDVASPPDGGGDAHPLVVMIHGGAWSVGDKADERPRDFIRRLASIGYVAASVNYRLATPDGERSFPAAVEDVRCAVRWIRARADRWGADPSRVVAAGMSAGGHLALMLALAGDAEGFDGACGDTGPVALDGAISYYGPTDLRADQFTDPVGEALIAGFLGAPASEVPEVAERASPLAWADASDPAPLLVHGGGDGVVPASQSRALQATLEALGVASTYVEVPLAPHAFAGITEQARYRVSTCTTLAYLDDVFAP